MFSVILNQECTEENKIVILTQGGTVFRDAIAGLLATGQYGSDGTTESTSDTSLGTPIGDSQKTLAITKSNLTIQAEHDLLSTESNGETLREYALQTTTQDLTRVTTTDVSKDNTKEVVTTSFIFLDIN